MRLFTLVSPMLRWKSSAATAAWVALSIASAVGCDDGATRSRGTPTDAQEPTPAAAVPAPRSPAHTNLVLITLDTTRADALGPYGQELPISPHLDRLAAQGVVFEHVTTTNPETLPSHASIFTGMWPFAHGVRANSGFVLSDRHTTLAEHLAERGYATGAEVAALVLREGTQVTQGFEVRHDPSTPGARLKQVEVKKADEGTRTLSVRVGSDITARAIEFIRKHRKEPFFLWLHYFDAHRPYAPPPVYARRSPNSLYHAEVAHTDAQVGSVVSEIERLGLRDQTIVAITSDHGEGLMEHGEPTHTYYVYDSVMRVPLIFWGHRELPRGKRFSAPVRTVDVAPTVLDLMGLPPLAAAQGRSLVPILEGAKTDLGLTGYGEATRFKVAFGLPVLRFVREGRWKYIHKVNPELYDVLEDPQETDNVAAQHPEIVQRLRARLEAMLRAAPPQPDDAQAAIDAATARQLIALGYAAHAPDVDFADELESLATSGVDPTSLSPDVAAMTHVRVLIGNERYEAALDAIGPVAERHPESVTVLRFYAKSLAGVGRHEEALATVRRILELAPDDPVSRHELAVQLYAAGREDEAIAKLEELLAEDPCAQWIRFDQVHWLEELDRPRERVAALAQSHSACPELVTLSNNYAWALATLPDETLRDGQRAVEVISGIIEASEVPDPAHLDTLSAALAETGDFIGAQRAIERAIAVLRSAGAPPELLAELEARLEQYASGRPARDPATS